MFSDDRESPGEDIYEESDNGTIICLGCQRPYHRSCLSVSPDSSGLKFCPSCLKVEVKGNFFNGLRKPMSMAYASGTALFVEELKNRTFNSADGIVLTAKSNEITEDFFKLNGFKQPILIDDSTHLGVRVPSFRDYKQIHDCVGRNGLSMVDVIDVEHQEQIQMSVDSFFDYITSKDRSKVLNMISMEVSETKLADFIEPPEVIKNIDWAHMYWSEPKPGHNPTMPKSVEKYCLISACNSFTDFHIDFSGTSVWYHVVQGRKLFYLIKPSATNNSLYWKWLNSNNRLNTCFADQADDCYLMAITPGQTLLLPTGWIHAVLTLEDSIVYGGNFLCTFNAPMQLAIYDMESRQDTPPRFMYPFFKELNWFAAKGLCDELTYFNSMKSSSAPQHLVLALRALLISLKSWITVLPPNLRSYYSAEGLIKEISKQLRRSERQSMIVNPPKPMRESTRIRKKTVFTDYVCFEDVRKFSAKNNKGSTESLRSTIQELSGGETDSLPNEDENWQIKGENLKVLIKRTKPDPFSTLRVGMAEEESDEDPGPSKVTKKPKIKKTPSIKTETKKAESEADSYDSVSYHSSDEDSIGDIASNHGDATWNPKSLKPSYSYKSNASLKRKKSQTDSKKAESGVINRDKQTQISVPIKKTYKPKSIVAKPSPTQSQTSEKASRHRKGTTAKQRLSKILKMHKMMR